MCANDTIEPGLCVGARISGAGINALKFIGIIAVGYVLFMGAMVVMFGAFCGGMSEIF